MGEGNARPGRWPLWPLLKTLWLPFPSSVSDGAGGLSWETCFSVSLLSSTYLPPKRNSGVGADGINSFLWPSIHSSIHLSPIIPSSLLHSLTRPVFFPSTFTSPVSPSLPSFFPSPSLASFVLFFPSSFFSLFLPLFLYLSFVPFTLSSFHPSSILPCIQHRVVQGTVLGSVFSWSAWSMGMYDQTRTIQVNGCVIGVGER